MTSVHRQESAMSECCSISLSQQLSMDKMNTISRLLSIIFVGITWLENASNRQPSDEAKRVDGEAMFLFRAALLICKAHGNVGAVTCHQRESSRGCMHLQLLILPGL